MKTIAAFVLALAISTVAASTDRPEYFDSFDPIKGFKPAQRDLTEIFLQIAGSLEQYGSPEPYLRHMAKEHARIDALYQRKFVAASKSYRPVDMTDGYINRLCANWNVLSPKFGLESYAKEVGNVMRDAIRGTRGTGTIIVEIFNQHQSRVFNVMAGKNIPSADFENLKSQLITRLELDKKIVDEGSYEVAHRDAVSYAIIIHGITMKLFKQVDEKLQPTDSARVKTALSSVFTDVGRMAQSELEAGLAEWALLRSDTK